MKRLLITCNSWETFLMNVKDPVWHDLNDPWSQDSKSDCSGYVYVIQDLESGLFKIGYTKNLIVDLMSLVWN